ncbi:MAG: putative lipid II flippase FtsW [Clostridia bacterium]|nr:putative lipid II flippase FtsW [Clostridia bacterium]
MSKRKINTKRIVGKIKETDLQFLALVYTLLTFGLIMVLSASSPSAFTYHDNSFYFFNRQLLWAIIGSAGMFAVSMIDYRLYRKHIMKIVLGALFLIIIVLIPGIGQVINGARRWIKIGPISFQADEFAKIMIIIFLANAISTHPDRIKKMKYVATYFICACVVAGIVILEPHKSCAIVIVMVSAIMLYVGGADIKKILPAGLVIAGILFVVIMLSEYSRERILSFLDPFKDIQGDGWQVVQSLYAIGSGGILGVGPGKSRQKYLNIPEPQNDFIFSIIAEELGLFGGLLVMVLFSLLIIRGIKIAFNAPDMFGSLLVVGFMALIAVQVIINIAVVTASMPCTGMPLPFFSYGGTSLAITMGTMGIVLNVARQSRNKSGE